MAIEPNHPQWARDEGRLALHEMFERRVKILLRGAALFVAAIVVLYGCAWGMAQAALAQ